MNLSWIDWGMMAVAIIGLRFVSLSTRRHMKGVADFLSANRCAGRYLLTIASAMGNFGAVSVIALSELYYQAGFTAIWWSFMVASIPTIATLTGWIYYRFRETRALTLAQFLEMRYSRRLRIFAGILCFTSGILNFGIFPAVAARFFVYFCGLPEYFLLPGIDLPIPTFAVVMLADLALALTFVTMGGQISVMVTECVQGFIAGFGFLIISAAVLLQVKWPRIVEALSATPPDASMLDPFRTSHVKDFNVWYFIIAFITGLYTHMSWQGGQAFYSSGRSPHEQRMGGIIGVWRGVPGAMMTLLLPIAAVAVLRLPEFSAQATVINSALSNIDNEAIRGQMRMPIALAHVLPIGVKGLMATIMLFYSFTCHDTYMHSWGSIFVQDVYMPIRNRPMEPERHIRLLRRSITGVAIFAFLFSLFYQPSEHILMFFAITGTVWLAGSGIIIIGGLYWRKGTTPAAYAALIIGAVVGIGGLITPKIYESYYHRDFPINEQWIYFLTAIAASLAYLIISLATCRKRFDLERMLGRGKYARADLQRAEVIEKGRWRQLLGFTREFSRGDKVLAVSVAVWSLVWVVMFFTLTPINIISPFGAAWWAKFWHFYVMILLIVSVPTTIWITIGGIIDIRALFRTLSTMVRNHADDGRVLHELEQSGEPCLIPDGMSVPTPGVNPKNPSE